MKQCNSKYTGPLGQIASRQLVEQRRRPTEGIIGIAPNVWTVAGITGVNHHVIDAPEGLIVIDSGPNANVGIRLYEHIRSVSQRPIAALVYSHSHFCFGSKTLLANENFSKVEIHAHRRCHDNVCRTISHEEPGLFFARLAQSGAILPQEGPDADPIGLPAGLVGPRSYLPPDVLWDENGSDGMIAGEPVRVFTAYPFDSNDQLMIFFPRLDLLVHGHLSCNFPAIASNGGGRFRDPQPWLDGLDLILSLKPEYLLGVHGPHVCGKEKVYSTVMEQRDALQFVYDQTVRAINRGLTPREAVDEIDLPAELAGSPGLHQDYAPWNYHIPAIYSGLMNWYSGDATELLPMNQKVESEAMIRGFGGWDRMLATIRTEMDQNNWVWAARLARHCVRVMPDSAEARLLLAAALRAIGHAADSITTRSICLTQAREWEGHASRRDVALDFDISIARLAPPGTWVRALGFRLKAGKAYGLEKTIIIRFTDNDYTCGLSIRRSVAVFLTQKQLPSSADFEAILSQSDWLLWFMGKITWDELLSSGHVLSSQNSAEWRDLWQYFDKWPPIALNQP